MEPATAQNSSETQSQDVCFTSVTSTGSDPARVARVSPLLATPTPSSPVATPRLIVTPATPPPGLQTFPPTDGGRQAITDRYRSRGHQFRNENGEDRRSVNNNSAIYKNSNWTQWRSHGTGGEGYTGIKRYEEGDGYNWRRADGEETTGSSRRYDGRDGSNWRGHQGGGDNSNWREVEKLAPMSIDQEEVNKKLLELQNKTGYEIVQRHGQRIYGGPPPGWQGLPPGRKTEIYCYKIPRDCFEDELVPVFERVAQLYELRLMIEFSGTNRTYCYVRYRNTEDAEKAIKVLNGYEIRKNHYLAVTESVDNRRLWINGIPKDKTAQELKEEIKKTTDDVENVILYPHPHEQGLSRGYMFVEYETHRAAALARRKLVPGKVFLFGQEVGQVDWAEPEEEGDEEQMKSSTILFVRNLDVITRESTIRAQFNYLCGGRVEKVKKPKDFAFVHFINHEAAEEAYNRRDNLEIDGRKVEVKWGKPSEKESGTRKYLDRHAPHNQVVSQEAPPASPMSQPPPYYNMTPDQQLLELCRRNNWGEPIYQMYVHNLGDRDGGRGPTFYLYKVAIPHFPSPYPHNVFQGPSWKLSEIAAKTEVAQHILHQLRPDPTIAIRNLEAMLNLQQGLQQQQQRLQLQQQQQNLSIQQQNLPIQPIQQQNLPIQQPYIQAQQQVSAGVCRLGTDQQQPYVSAAGSILSPAGQAGPVLGYTPLRVQQS